MLGGEPVPESRLTLPPGGVDDPIVLEIIRRMLHSLDAANVRGSWMIVEEDEVVGLCGYRRAPREGRVEIGYGIAASRRQRGYATGAVAAMIQVSQSDPRMQELVAETGVENTPSSQVLIKNGFEQTGTRHDPEDGEVFTWRKNLKTT